MIPANDASRANRSLFEAFASRDWDRFGGRLSMALRIDDHRKLVGGVSGDKRAFVEVWRTIADQGYDRLTATDLATRGECVALQRFVAEGSRGFAGEVLAVTETTDGRMSFVALYDLEDADDAFAELDHRFVTGEGRRYADVLTVASTMTSSYNARDWDRYASIIDEGFTLIDHIPAAVGDVHGRERYVEYIRGMTDLVPDVRLRIVRDIALSVTGGVSEAHLRGASPDGGEVEIAWLDVAVVKAGRLVRLEQFPPERPDDALKRAAELSVA